MVYKKHFLWKSQFDTAINNLHAMGIIKQFLVRNARFLTNIPEPPGSESSSSQLVVMQPQHIMTPLLILAIGFVLSMAVFFYEVANGRRGQKRVKKSDDDPRNKANSVYILKKERQ